MPSNTEHLIPEVREAIANAAENGYPVDDWSDLKLAQDLYWTADFTLTLSMDEVLQLVKDYRALE